MGVDFIDYAVVDEFVVPPDQQPYLHRTSGLSARHLSAEQFPAGVGCHAIARDCGLPENAFVFCCFNQTYKITPEARLMSGCESCARARLRLMATKAGRGDREQSAARGCQTWRQRRASWRSRRKYAGRPSGRATVMAGLFLDTLVVNALTTASDALHMGIPIITCPGADLRLACAPEALLRALEMPELICDSLANYEELAMALAAKPDLLHSVKKKIAAKRETAPLFNSTRYTRHLDAAYREMWRLNQAGERPKPFTIDPIFS